MELPYNPKDKKSIIEYAKMLIGKSLRDTCNPEILKHSYEGKGNFGQVLEKFYFGYEPNSNSEPDFKEVGMELKSSPLKSLRNKEYRSKERMVLNLINYMEVANQSFEESDFWKKNRNILLVFYLHHVESDILDYIIKLVEEWDFPDTDLQIIKNDWELIKQKIVDGKAHELSEGDTFYLGACTKGGKGGNLREQPKSQIRAKQRAYSLKQGYVNHIIATIANDTMGVYGKLIKSKNEIKERTIEDIVIATFSQFYGMSVEEISKITGVELNFEKQKNFYSRVTHAILNIELNKSIEEFEKANIEIKTVRVELNNDIAQSISFPAFKFERVYHENWITSELKDMIEKKFLFIFFKFDGNSYILEIAKFWNMPPESRKEVRKVWLQTKKVIQEGRIFKDFAKDKQGNIRVSNKGNQIRLNNLPKIKDNPVCHVRPHGGDSKETYPLPVEDRVLKVREYSKQCFWLSNTYVRDEIYLK
jgi:DNA mismatch repair protein MutH